MRPVPEPAEWIFTALTRRRGSESFPAPAHRQPVDLRSILKRVLLPLYRLIRPVVRPPLWRLRTFMTQPLVTEHQVERGLFAGLTAKLVGLEAEIHRISLMQAQLLEELEQMRDELNSEMESIQDQLGNNVTQGATLRKLSKR
jgi:hypothetical protein